MRIVIDMQGAQTSSRYRGIGRYTMAIAQAMVRNRAGHEVILVLNGMFAQSVTAIRNAFSQSLPEQNVVVWMAPGPVNASDTANNCREKVAEQLRESFLASLQPDVVYLSSLFEGFIDNAITSVAAFDQKTLICATIYDLIPLLNPEQYLAPHPTYARYYRHKVEQMKKAGLLLAISESSRHEAIDHLHVQPHRVVNIAAACDEIFTPRQLDQTTRQTLLKKWGIEQDFILYTGGADDRKNLPRLIQAFADLPHAVRHGCQLLFAGKLSDVEITHLQTVASAHGLPARELRFTGFVTDDELVSAYSLCRLFVFPSWHEGFGLPPLEAMSCGAAVIAGNTSSLPEVVGMASALFDPFSIEDMARKIHQALTDQTFRETLLENGRRQARKFSWDASAQSAIKAFERAHRQRAHARVQMRPWAELQASHYRQTLQAVSRVLKAHPMVTKAELLSLASCMAHNETIAQTHTRKDLLPTVIQWRLEGPFDSSYSLALVNREYARALEKMGHQVALHSSEGPGDFAANVQFLQAHPDLARLHQRAATMPVAHADVLSRFMYPPRVLDMKARCNALHCYGWEESQFPPAWVDEFNQHLQGITVMSTHVQKLLVDNGVRVPLAVVGLGVDHWERVPADTAFRLHAKSFRFLHVSSCFPRKGVQAMLRAYGQAFSAQDDVTLIIKTFENPHNDVLRWLHQAQASVPDYPDVQILQGDYSDAQLKALYQQCHALIAPSKAEGFGLPLAEAMLSGLAVVTTGWGGQLDFCSAETAWLVDYTFARAHSHFRLADSVWAEPDTGHLAQVLRQVHDAPDSVRQQRANAGRQRLLSQFTWAQVAERSTQAMRLWAASSAPPRLRIGWVSSWHTRCGIASYSEHLLRHMTQDIQILASHAIEPTQEDDAQVTRCWHQGDQDHLSELAQAIQLADMDILVIQFNYGFFDFPKFASFLRTQVNAGRTVVVEMHSTTDPVQASYKRLSELVPALSLCARILVHSVADMNRLKHHGLVHNVSLFPLGVLDHEAQRPSPHTDRAMVVASYGFFLPHKGLLELIDAILMLQAQGMPVRLNMVNAQYPAPQSAQAIDQAQAKIMAAQAQDSIELITQYLDDSESLRQLAQADLIVFPYQETGESASAAVRHGLASGRQVAVTPLGIFEDVKDAVHELPGTTPEHIAQGIQALWVQIKENAQSMQDKTAQAEQWREQHRHSRLAKRMDNMLMGLHQERDQWPGSHFHLIHSNPI